MIRYQKTDIGAIGFHGIPIHVSDGTCTRPTPSSAPACRAAASARTTSTPLFLWAFADVGTPVVVV